MTVWPLLQRELRLRARQKATYWWRFAAAGITALIATQSAMVYASSKGTPAVGAEMFAAIAWFGLVLSCLAVLTTADCVSSERREGTLGLLFLTELKGFEVALAKLSAAGLTAVATLIGLIPILALGQLVGGITMGSVARAGLALLNLLFVSLCAGLLVSARSQNRRKAMVRSLWFVLFLNALPWCAARGLVHYGGAVLTVFSPYTAFHLAPEVPYVVATRQFWLSLIITHCEGWLLLALATRSLMQNWRTVEISEKDKPVSIEPLLEQEAQAMAQSRAALRQGDPVCWAVSRVRGHSALIWGGAMLLLLLGGTGFSMESYLVGSWLIPGATGLWNCLNMLLNFGAAAFLAWGAGRGLFTAQRSGELELLLCTPLGAREIINGHWRAICLPLRGAWLLVALMFFLQFILLPGGSSGVGVVGGTVLFHRIMAPLNLVLDIIALCWVGMWFGMRAQRAFSLIGWTVGLVIGLPWIITFLADAAFITAGRSQWGPTGGGRTIFFWLWASAFLFLLKNILLIRWSVWKLRTELKATASLKVGEWAGKQTP